MRDKYRKQFAWRKRNPWVRHVEWARRRCRGAKGVNPTSDYSGRGITCVLTSADARRLWERDNAAGMRCPTLDRKDPQQDYTLDNCRFVEMTVNSRRVHGGRYDDLAENQLTREEGTDGRTVEGVDEGGQCGRELLREGGASGGAVAAGAGGPAESLGGGIVGDGAYDAWNDPGLAAA